MAQHARPIGPSTNVEAPFGPEMVQGAQPDRPANRPMWATYPQRQGMQLSQTTPVEAPFTPDMVQGSQPPRFRETRPPRVGWTMWISDVLLFDSAMVQGYYPDRPRLFLAPRIPLPWSQTTPTEASFSLEMVQGTLAPEIPAPRLQRGSGSAPPDVLTFSVEMFQGWHPDAPRLFSAPRLAVPWSETIQVQAPFSVEMGQGSAPVRNREDRPLRTIGWSVSQLTPVPAVFSVEMTRGWYPDRALNFLAPRIPLPVAETTQVSAPFSVEMTQGATPERARRQDLRGKLGWTVLIEAPSTLQFTVRLDLVTLGTELSFVISPDGALGGRGSF